jgi:hypothetical protein
LPKQVRQTFIGEPAVLVTTPQGASYVARSQKPASPNDLEAFWMPFTPNRSFEKHPRIIVRSKDMHYFTSKAVRCSTVRRG